MKKPELLSPAGSLLHLKSAVENGADAVYLGMKQYSARRNAANFSLEELQEGIQYAHFRDVKVYVALNILIKQDELSEALRLVGEANALGVDAFIIQDLGLAREIIGAYPGIKLHLSTQGTIYNSEGAAFAKEMGFSRVVLARELSKAGIQQIMQDVEIETEVFVQGALCMCYSGQCMMSSMAGGRSGNRGDCAQPCRLPYTLTGNESLLSKEQYLLSPKDLCLLGALDQIMSLNVTSLKIEGRLKSPEYTGLMTSIYRKYIDETYKRKYAVEIEKDDLEKMKQVFHRGYTTGYFYQNQNAKLLSGESPKHQGLLLGFVQQMKPSAQSPGKYLLQVKLGRELSVGDGVEARPSFSGGVVSYIRGRSEILKTAKAGETVWIGDIPGEISHRETLFKVTDKQLMREIADSYLGKPKRKIAIQGAFFAKEGERMVFRVWDQNGNEGMAVSTESPERAISMPTSRMQIEKQVMKTGSTPFILTECDIQIEGNLMIPLSQVNHLRREALEKLSDAKKG